jgi:hypothetical protein
MNLLASPDHTEANVTPRPGMPGLTAVRRDLLRREMQTNGRLESKVGEAMSPKDKGKLRMRWSRSNGRDCSALRAIGSGFPEITRDHTRITLPGRSQWCGVIPVYGGHHHTAPV